MSLNTPPLGRTQRDYGRSGLDGGGGADAQPVFSAPRDIKDDLEKIFNTKVDVIRYRKNMNPYLLKQIDADAIYV